MCWRYVVAYVHIWYIEGTCIGVTWWHMFIFGLLKVHVLALRGGICLYWYNEGTCIGVTWWHMFIFGLLKVQVLALRGGICSCLVY